MDKESFALKWHNQIVKNKPHWYAGIPVNEYLVTAALYNHEGDITIFSIMNLDYNTNKKHWFAIRIENRHLESALKDFEIIENHPEKEIAIKLQGKLSKLLI